MTKDRNQQDDDREPTDDEPEAHDEEEADEGDADDERAGKKHADGGDDDPDDEEREGDADEDEDEEEDEAPAPKAAAKGSDKAAASAPAAATKPAAKRKTATAGAARPVRAGGAAASPKKASGMRSILIYAAIIGGIALAFAYLGQQGGGGDAEVPQPEWKEGDVADVTITLVTTDVKDLGCAAEEELKGLHCGFAEKRKPHPKGSDARADDKVLQPYTTVNRIQFLAAGMWLSPDLKAKLDAEDWSNPSPRFNVDCKYKVEGKMKDALIRWKPENDWAPARELYVGSLSDCKVRQGSSARKGAPKTKAEPPPE